MAADYLEDIGKRSRGAMGALRRASAEQKREALGFAAQQLQKNRADILVQNQKDIQGAVAAKRSLHFIDRLTLTEAKITRMIDSVESVRTLPEVVGTIEHAVEQPNGIRVGRMRVPIGVIAIIYESRPNVTAECASLCIKSSNVIILRGGSEAIHSNQIISEAFVQGLRHAGLPSDACQLIENTDRALVPKLLAMEDYIDLVIPRGGKDLIRVVRNHATIPRLDHLDGVCHLYCDAGCDVDQALSICVNAKTKGVSLCNTAETILVHHASSKALLPTLCAALAEKGVEVRGCPVVQSLFPSAVAATEDDWHTEYLAPIVSIRVVDAIDQAIGHIETYGSHHTDSILSCNHQSIDYFIKMVDSSSVMVNTSTRLADGFEYGLGAEIGVSTAKLHARGPVGLKGLTTEKFVVTSDGALKR